MANMSYCRFRNTLNDLRDCYDTLSEEGLIGLSFEELQAAKKLIELCGDISADFGEIGEEDGDEEE